MAQRVLVTGGLGYIGSILCEHLLDAGFRVTALDNLMYGAGQQFLGLGEIQPGGLLRPLRLISASANRA